MARLPRLYLPGQLHYVRQRSVDERAAWLNEADRAEFLALLQQASREYGLEIHAFVLLNSQFDLLCTPTQDTSLSKTLQWLSRRYVTAFNRKVGRSGALWQSRYRSTVLEADWLIPALVALENLPCFAGLAAEAGAYHWSSARHHLGLVSHALLADPPAYWGLGNTPYERQAAYKTLLEAGLSSSRLEALNKAIETGWPLGSPAWLQELGQITARRVLPASAGRPKKMSQSAEK